MADITMCSSNACPMRNNCYRHTATPNPWRQSYFPSPPWVIRQGESHCDHFWDNSEWRKHASDSSSAAPVPFAEES